MSSKTLTWRSLFRKRRMRRPGPASARSTRLGGVDRYPLGDIAARQPPGGYEVFFDSPSLELGVYVLVAPDPDKQEPHDRDEVYVVLEGEGVLTVEGKELQLSPGDAAFVAAGDDHRFSRYERLVLFVLFDNTTKTE